MPRTVESGAFLISGLFSVRCVMPARPGMSVSVRGPWRGSLGAGGRGVELSGGSRIRSCRAGGVGAPRMPSCDLAPSAGAARSQKGVRRGVRGGGPAGTPAAAGVRGRRPRRRRRMRSRRRAAAPRARGGCATSSPRMSSVSGRAGGTQTGVGWNRTGLVYDSDGMDCQGYREVLSARLDGEAGDDERAAAEDHLAGCASCRAFADGADRLGRLARVGPADPLPDLTDRVLAALGVSAPAPAPPLPAVPRLSCLDGGCCSGAAGRAPVGVVPSACGCASTCGCGCQQGAPCRCAVRAA
ncbi:hypothetical protein DMP15_11120 [Pseudonocardia sp. UM4_GMWB1]